MVYKGKSQSKMDDLGNLGHIIPLEYLQLWPEIPVINGEMTGYFSGVVHSITVFFLMYLYIYI